MVTDTKTYLDDSESFHALVAAMPEPEQTEYKSYGALNLESVFPGRKLVLYTLKSGSPSDIEVISFGSLSVDWDNGPTFEVYDALGTTQMLAVPKRLRPRDVFMQVPQNFNLKYRGKVSPERTLDFITHYAVLIKTRSKEIHQVEGHTYVVTLNKFRERFPALKIRY